MSTRGFNSHYRAAALQCVSMMFHASSAGRALAEPMRASELNGYLEDVANLDSRRNMAVLDLDHVKAIRDNLDPKRRVSDGGLPELITETRFTDDSCYLEVVGARNMEALDKVKGVDIPVVIALKGPQSLYGTGLFPVMMADCCPDTLNCGNAIAHIPCFAISQETLEIPHEQANRIASFMEGFVAAVTLSPATQGGLDQTALEAGRRYAVKAECPESLSVREVMDVAIRKCVKEPNEQIQQAKRATDVGYRDFM